jgi:hypothetical protein
VRERSRMLGGPSESRSPATRVTEALHPSYVELHTRSQWKPGYQGLKRVPYLTDKAVREKRRRHTFAAEFDGRR